MNLFTPQQAALHQRALTVTRNYLRCEREMILVLQEVEKIKLYKKLQHRSLFEYATCELGLSESVAYAFIAVTRKSLEVPQLMTAISDQSLSVAKASRIVRSLNKENASHLLEFAKTHSTRESEFEEARLNPRSGSLDRIKPLSGDMVQVTITISRAALKNFERVKALEGKDNSDSFAAMLKVYLWHKDPVQKAARSKKNSERSEFSSQGRRPKAHEKHQVNRRDEGKCTFVDEHGVRCNCDRWTEIHHVVPVSEGGSNDPSNLTTLCSFHHDLVHQLSFPLEKQMTWLRDQSVSYLPDDLARSS